MQIKMNLFCPKHGGNFKPWLQFAFYSGGKIDEHNKKNSKRGNKRSKDDAACPEVEQEVTSAIHDWIGENR